MLLRKNLALFLLPLACGIPAAHAIFSDGEARQQILQLRTQIAEQQRAVDARIAELEAQARNRSIIDLFNQVETLRAELARLRGLTETLQNELETAQRRQRDLYVDLDGRMRKLEATVGELRSALAAAQPSGQAPAPGATPPASTPPAGAPGAAPPGSTPAAAAPVTPADPAAEQRLYDAGLELFRLGRFADAVTTFQSFLRLHPRSPLAPQAHYWLGNSLFALRDYRGAIAAQRQLLANHPDSAKAPDGLLNIATAQAELGEIAAARATLQEVIQRYPASEAAAKARQRLGQR
jgi:tol-pal system protein YbgF